MQDPPDRNSRHYTRPGAIVELDRWMNQSPWHPRVAPFAVYVLMMPLTDFFRHNYMWGAPAVYLLQCILVSLMLWRYRKLTPELTITFHWLALPVGLIVAAAWVGLGLLMVEWFPSKFGSDTSKHYLESYGPDLRAVSMPIRLLGIAVLVPLFEELFVRSLLLRALSSFRFTGVGILQVLGDLPIIGSWFMQTDLARRADRHTNIFTTQFERTPLGVVTLFGFIASTFLFASYHAPRDWAGCVVCAAAYCALLRFTRDKGLGPIVWAHGVTNAALWGYVWITGDWQFL